MEDVGEQHSIDECRELEGGAHDVCDDEIDLRYATQRRQRFGVVVDGVDVASGTQSLEQRAREGPVAGADVRPSPPFVVDRAGDEVDCFARVQATAAAVAAGTFARPRYARYSMIPLMITCGMFNRTFPITSVP